MFELSDNLDIKKEVFCKTIIYTIDNFYKYPDEILKYLFEKPAPLHKDYDDPSYNNILFEDRRYNFYDSRLVPVIDFLSNLISTILFYITQFKHIGFPTFPQRNTSCINN